MRKTESPSTLQMENFYSKTLTLQRLLKPLSNIRPRLIENSEVCSVNRNYGLWKATCIRLQAALSSAVSWHYYLNLPQGQLFSASFRRKRQPLLGLRSALSVKQRLVDNSVDLPLAVFGRAELILWKRKCRICRKYEYNKRRNKGVSASVINGWVLSVYLREFTSYVQATSETPIPFLTAA